MCPEINIGRIMKLNEEFSGFDVAHQSSVIPSTCRSVSTLKWRRRLLIGLFFTTMQEDNIALCDTLAVDAAKRFYTLIPRV